MTEQCEFESRLSKMYLYIEIFKVLLDIPLMCKVKCDVGFYYRIGNISKTEFVAQYVYCGFDSYSGNDFFFDIFKGLFHTLERTILFRKQIKILT